MLDFFLDLLIGESQAAPHYWAAVLLAHAMLGIALMICAGLVAAALLGDAVAGLVLVASGYAVWECVQFIGGAGWADCFVDWLAVMLGASVALALMRSRPGKAGAGIVALLSVLLAGVWGRTRKEPRK